MKMWGVVLLLVVIAASARADVPTIVPVEGYLADVEGVPVMGEVTLTLSLYATDGNEAIPDEQALYRAPRQQVSLQDGVFTLLLDDPQVFGLFLQGSPLFLQVELEGEGGPEVLRPRIRLGTVPYAAVAGDATSFGGRRADTLFDGESDRIRWDAVSVPDGLRDGEDDDTLQSLRTTNDLSCADGDIPQYASGAWHCGPPAPVDAGTTLDELGLQCVDGAVARFSLGAWTCEPLVLPEPLAPTWFDVRAHGAVPDDGGVDTQAFQDALNAAALRGGTVYVPRGTFHIDGTLALRSQCAQPEPRLVQGVTMRGDGAKVSMLAWVGAHTPEVESRSLDQPFDLAPGSTCPLVGSGCPSIPMILLEGTADMRVEGLGLVAQSFLDVGVLSRPVAGCTSGRYRFSDLTIASAGARLGVGILFEGDRDNVSNGDVVYDHVAMNGYRFAGVAVAHANSRNHLLLAPAFTDSAGVFGYYGLIGPHIVQARFNNHTRAHVYQAGISQSLWIDGCNADVGPLLVEAYGNCSGHGIRVQGCMVDGSPAPTGYRIRAESVSSLSLIDNYFDHPSARVGMSGQPCRASTLTATGNVFHEHVNPEAAIETTGARRAYLLGNRAGRSDSGADVMIADRVDGQASGTLTVAANDDVETRVDEPVRRSSSKVLLTPTNEQAAEMMSQGNVFVRKPDDGHVTVSHATGAIAGATFDYVVFP